MVILLIGQILLKIGSEKHALVGGKKFGCFSIILADSNINKNSILYTNRQNQNSHFSHHLHPFVIQYILHKQGIKAI